MTQEETIENNKLIAEFMGGEFANHNCQPTAYWEFWKDEPPSNAPYIFNRHLKYHTSWDWLMPVYSKAMQETENDGGDEHFDLQNYFEDAAMNNRIDLAFSAVVEFIKWYNLQK